MDLSRRRFLGGTAASAWWATSAARTRALDETARRASSIEGTTLSVTVVRPNGPGYVKLREGPGWPTVVRSELRELDTARDTRRRAVAAFAHLTDVHLIDAQSPGRVEFLDGLGEPFTGAYRPQETLTTQVQASMVQRLVDLQRAPITGRRLDCAVSTGDNIDNCQHNELDWFIGVLDGGTVTANSGDQHRYEGVQATEWGDPRYWHPDGGIADTYLAAGFPTVPGLLDAAIAPHRSPGLDIAWYSTYGNHDGLIQGNVPRSDAFDELLVADFKITDLPHGVSAVTFLAEAIGDTAAIRRRVADGSMPHQSVTADPQRRSLTTQDWVHAHLASTHRPSPAGHGYTEDHLDGRPLSYRFEIAPGVVGISMDTGGYNSGSIGEDQLRFLEATLSAVHSRSFDSSGGEVRSGNDDQLVVLFSHFTSETMTGAPPDPSHPGERRIEGEELVAFLHRWPNLVAWVNGHTHTNEVRPMPDRSGRTGGFWQITTASHVDFPEHARSWSWSTTTTGRCRSSPRWLSTPRRSWPTTTTCPRSGWRRSAGSSPRTVSRRRR
ncbi:MAG: TIGR03767 family metallophosphoesterase [Microthrixaceae bacterium]|nr:TIGR03767 family metallophosphoesterase [Microthrixaceae bacterium]